MDVPLRAWADLDLDALRANLARFRRIVPAGCEVVGVVKADAYGHGAIAIARALREEGVETLGVACVEEAVELRDDGFTGAIWHLGVPLAEEAAALVHYRIVPTCADAALIDALAGAVDEGSRFPIQLKLDTGMGRRGTDLDGAKQLWERATRTGRLEVAALTTHFATADGDLEFAREQLRRFQIWRSELAAAGLNAPAVQVANGAAALRLRETHCDAIRPGLAMYGIGGETDGLRPVMSVRSRICQLRNLPAGHEVGYAHGHRLARPTRVGLVPIGYGDGWSWRLSDVGRALVGGRAAAYLGRVNMDLIQLDLNNAPAASVGDTVVLLGQDGEAELRATEVAGWAGVSPYTVTTCLTRRVTRRYWSDGRLVAERRLDGRLRETAAGPGD